MTRGSRLKATSPRPPTGTKPNVQCPHVYFSPLTTALTLADPVKALYFAILV